MPLAPLPANNTIRVWLAYTSVGIKHETCFRQPTGTPTGDIIVNANAFAQTMKVQLLTTDKFTGLRWSQAGSNLSFPLAFTAVSGTQVGTVDKDAKAKFYAISGRSVAGRRCRVTFFTPFLADSEGYRVNVLSTLYNAVMAMEPDAVAKDGQSVVWNQYTNIGYNSYWQRQLRTIG